jgi:hypothetical protein
VTSDSGSLASLNLPLSERPNTYSNTNQIATWNTHSATTDSASSLTTDPVTGALHSWDARNQLSAISGGTAASFTASYDAILRRNSQITAFGGTTTYVNDKRDPGVLGCQAAAGALLGPGTAYVDYKPLQNCKAEYAACGR